MTKKEREYCKAHASELKKRGMVYNEKTGTIETVERNYINGKPPKKQNKSKKK